MKKNYDSRLRMYNATYEVMKANEGTFASYPALMTAYTSFGESIQNLLSQKQQQEKNLKGYASEKTAKRDAMADIALKVRGKVSAYARASGNDVLFKEMQISDSKIKYGKSTTALTLALSIFDAADAMPAAAKTQYDLTAAMLTSLENEIESYKAVMSAPRVAEAQRKTFTSGITDAVKAISSFLRNEMDGLMRIYDGKEFFSDYTNARRIVEEPTLQARVIGTVLAENGNPVAGAKVEMTAGNIIYEDMTDENGKYRLRNISPELYMFKVTKSGFTDYTIPDVDIYAGEHEKVNVEIKPNS
jgi:hypothetical protein